MHIVWGHSEIIWSGIVIKPSWRWFCTFGVPYNQRRVVPNPDKVVIWTQVELAMEEVVFLAVVANCLDWRNSPLGSDQSFFSSFRDSVLRFPWARRLMKKVPARFVRHFILNWSGLVKYPWESNRPLAFIRHFGILLSNLLGCGGFVLLCWPKVPPRSERNYSFFSAQWFRPFRIKINLISEFLAWPDGFALEY